MGTHPIFESDFDCLTDCLFQEMDVIRSESDRSRFLTEYLSQLKPVIFEDFFIANWESYKKWRTKDNRIDLEYLRETYSPYKIPVNNCLTYDCEEWPMDYYIDYLKRLRIGSLVFIHFNREDFRKNHLQLHIVTELGTRSDQKEKLGDEI